ncbi:MAG TPA: T9SS type A sorting domain-containing protein, partial [Flavipsychrobacter sp.]
QSWDSTLYKNVELVANASSAAELDNLIEKITAKLDDAHVEGLTYNVNSFFNKAYKPRLLLRYMDNKYVVVKTGIPGVAVGDEIVSVDGLTTTQWEDSLQHDISAGNPDVFRRFVCEYLLGGDLSSGINIVLRNATNNTYTANHTRGTYMYNQWFSDYYPNDTLKNAKWTTLDCNVGYVHMGNLEQTDVSNMYADLLTKPAIIFDIRNYPQGTAFTLANLMYPDRRMFAHDTEPEVTYPGAFRWFEHFLGPTSNSTDYKGKIILLMNQETQSHAEYSCMIFEAMPDVVKVGSPTAGADGNITYFNLTNDMQTGFTTLGIYYPNNNSTQRVGIVPDSLVYPTQAGTRAGRDEILEKAMQIGCAVSVRTNQLANVSAKIYPNPANNILNVELPAGQSVSVTITDVTGRTLLQTDIDNTSKRINITSLPQGLYLLKMESNERQQTYKFVKQ